MKIEMDRNFDISHKITVQSKTEYVELHTHDGYEFFLYIAGDSEYFVEGNYYKLEPFDAIVISRNEMHRVLHWSNTVYERVVISIDRDFFKETGCEEYEAIFMSREFEGNNKIPSKEVKESGLYDIIKAILKYSDDGKNQDKPVVRAAVIEFLYVLNDIKNFKRSENADSRITNIISYINENYSKNLTVDALAEKFFLSKNHLCRIFKKSTGYTLHYYINHKRLLAVRDLCREGMAIGEACTACGFSNYSSFYRFYVKENGSAPKYDLK